MLYTVHTGYREERLYGYTEKIEAQDKETAKKIAWENIKKKYPNAELEDQNARKSTRK